jgi:hypothetical protein
MIGVLVLRARRQLATARVTELLLGQCSDCGFQGAVGRHIGVWWRWREHEEPGGIIHAHSPHLKAASASRRHRRVGYNYGDDGNPRYYLRVMECIHSGVSGGDDAAVVNGRQATENAAHLREPTSSPSATMNESVNKTPAASQGDGGY